MAHPSFEIGIEIFEPQNDHEVPLGTVSRAKATCLCCGTVLSPDRVRAQLTAQNGGRILSLMKKKIVWRCTNARCSRLKPGEQGRNYRLPTTKDYEAIWKAQKELGKEAGKTTKKGIESSSR